MKNSTSRGTTIDTEKCVENIGNRFDLVIAASARSREISRRNRASNQLQHRHPIVSALLDIQEGRVGREYLKKVDWNPRVTLITLDKGGKGDARNPGCVRSKPDGRRDMPDPQSIS